MRYFDISHLKVSMKSSPLKANIVANCAGRVWQVLLSLSVVPVYLSMMGPEAYGMIGFFAGLQALLVLLDLGLGGTLCRELARCSVEHQGKRQERDIVRTLEVVYWGVGIFAGVLLLCLSPLIAGHWLKAEHLSVQVLQRSLVYMVLAIALQWPSSLYTSGLIGLQHQVLVNMVGICTSTIRVVGSVLAIWILEPTVEVFFEWQMLAAVVQTGMTRWLLWRSLPLDADNTRPRFSADILRRVWKFAGSLSATSVVIVLLAQIDKLILSAILPLNLFGYYMLANTIAQSLFLLPAPITDAMFPRYVQLAAQKNDAELIRLFHKSCQFVAGLMFPAAAVLALFSEDVLWLWTRDREIMQATWRVATVLLIGVALNGAMSMLDAIQMAYGWMKPAFLSRFAGLLIIGPFMWFLCNKYGALGAAIAWILIYAGYIIVTPSFVFDKILRTEKWQWYRSWAWTFVISFLMAGLLRVGLPHTGSPFLALAEIMSAWITIFLVNGVFSPAYRQLAQTAFYTWKYQKS